MCGTPDVIPDFIRDAPDQRIGRFIFGILECLKRSKLRVDCLQTLHHQIEDSKRPGQVLLGQGLKLATACLGGGQRAAAVRNDVCYCGFFVDQHSHDRFLSRPRAKKKWLERGAAKTLAGMSERASEGTGLGVCFPTEEEKVLSAHWE